MTALASKHEFTDSRDRDPRTKTILVADDDPMNLLLLAGFLETEGYEVITAIDGATAVDLYRRHPEPVSVALLDVQMPRLNGRETLDKLRTLDADLPVVVMSGMQSSAVEEMFDGTKVQGMISKPYRWETIRGAVRKALGDA